VKHNSKYVSQNVHFYYVLIIRYKVAFTELVSRNSRCEIFYLFSKNITLTAWICSSHVRRILSRCFLRATNNQKSDRANSVLYEMHGTTSSLMFYTAAEVANLVWCLELYVDEALSFHLMKGTDLFLQLGTSHNSRRGVSCHWKYTPDQRRLCIQENV
jgi:hypothetical protein